MPGNFVIKGHLPSYEDYMKVRKERLVKDRLEMDKRQIDFANSTYPGIEKALNQGLKSIEIKWSPSIEAGDTPWYKILKKDCLKEGWLVTPKGRYLIYELKIRHVSTLNWFEKLYHGCPSIFKPDSLLERRGGMVPTVSVCPLCDKESCSGCDG